MKRILFLSTLMCCLFICGQSIQAQTAVAKKCSPQEVAECAKAGDTETAVKATLVAETSTRKQCTPAQMAECAKVCDTKAMTAAVGLTPQTVAVAQTVPAKTASCDIKSCDPADCPLICQILCPIICGGATKAAMAEIATPSCKPAPSCQSVKGKKAQLASIQ